MPVIVVGNIGSKGIATGFHKNEKAIPIVINIIGNELIVVRMNMHSVIIIADFAVFDDIIIAGHIDAGRVAPSGYNLAGIDKSASIDCGSAQTIKCIACAADFDPFG
jgi:hypothetical protein